MKFGKWITILAKKYLVCIALTPLTVLPVQKNRVLLLNELSRKYAGNPKAVADCLAKTWANDFELYYAVDDEKNYGFLKEMGITPIRYRSLKYFLIAITSHVILTNAGGYSFLPKRKQQYVINTWHGGGCYKKVGLDVLGRSKFAIADVLLNTKKTSCLISTCRKLTHVFSSSFMIPENKIWEIGLPRNDLLLRDNTSEKIKIKEQLGVQEGYKLVLFAPTFRKEFDDQLGRMVSVDYGLDVDRLLNACRRRFGGEWVCAFRFHPKAVRRNVELPANVIDLSDYEDMQDLLLAADVMINDFSSSMWDFMLTGKPCFTFAVDLQHYIETTDVYTPVSEWPFPRAINNEELEKNILEFDEEKYAAACKRHYEALGGCETGEATKLVCERIYKVCFEDAGRKKRTS